MWSKRFSLLFYLRKPKNNDRGKQLVYMRITIDAARLELSAQRECEPERWNSRAGRGKGTEEEIRELNAYLDSLQAKVYKAHGACWTTMNWLQWQAFGQSLGALRKRVV